jgi:hypothetical protein
MNLRITLNLPNTLNIHVDTDDRIYPRARSRMGPKYQAIVADWDPETESEIIDPSQVRHPSDEATLPRTLSKQGFKGRRKRARVGDRKGGLFSYSSNFQHRLQILSLRISDASGSPTPQGSEVRSELSDKQDDFDQLDTTIARGGPDTVIPMFDRPTTFTDQQGKLYFTKKSQVFQF